MIKQQIKSVEIQNAPVVNELKSIDNQLNQINDKINKCKIINPISGTVLTTYAEPNEITTFGKPLYKIADLSTMQLRVYISETQLASIKIGQEVTVKIDDADAMKSYKGTIAGLLRKQNLHQKSFKLKKNVLLWFMQ